TDTNVPIQVASVAGFPSSGTFVIQIGQEQMLVTGGQGTTNWTVQRGYNGTALAFHGAGAHVSDISATTSLQNPIVNDNSIPIQVASATGFPSSGPFVIQIGQEQMLVTGGQGTTTWIAHPGYNGTFPAIHAAGTPLSMPFGLLADTSITSAVAAQPFTVQFRLTAADGGLFSLYSISLSGHGTITLNGTTANGQTVTQDLTVSASGGFQTFQLPSNFAGLEKVEWAPGS